MFISEYGNTNRIQKYYDFIPYVFFVLISFSVFLKPLENADEIWNYNFASKITLGLKPYADISMLQTPLSAYIASIFIFIFGDFLISYRIAGFVLMFCTVSVLYYLCCLITQNKTIAFVASAFTIAPHIDMWIYNYNYLSILIVLCIMLIYQKSREKVEVYEYFVAFLFGLLVLVKQNTGLILLLVFYSILIIELLYEKRRVKYIFVKGLISLVPAAVYIVYLIFSGTFQDFIEYAVMGIGSFSHRVSYFTFAFYSPLTFLLSLLPLCLFCYAIYYFYKHGYNGRKIKCFLISLGWMSIIYPLCDTYHFFSALIPAVPVFLMLISNKSITKKSAVCCNLIATAVTALSVFFSVQYSNEFVLSDLNHYQWIPITKTTQEDIKTVEEYIQQKWEQGYDVYIVSEYAAAYTIPLDHYTKNWDMLLVGNIGSFSTEDLLQTEKTSLYLVFDSDDRYGMQAHYELIEHIRNQYICVDEVLFFDVYKKE